MNTDLPQGSAATELPERCEVLVIGAGPAGSACAQLLAQAGIEAVLVDEASFPRDKICGDGLIPDAHEALERLGVHQEVMARAQPIECVRCVGPLGSHADIPSRLAVLPRRVLDEILVRAALRAGAALHTPWRFVGFLHDEAGRVRGARLQQGTLTRELHAGHTVLATGAGAQALAASKLSEELAPSGYGLRGYVRNPALTPLVPHLEIFWHPRLRNGYGWIFPCGDHVFNIGVGYWTQHKTNSQGLKRRNLRTMLDDFVATHANARALMQTGTVVHDFKGAPLRVSLQASRWSAPGVLVTGEAAGSTYNFSGEGIGKAMETGMLAAQALIDARVQGLGDEALASRYAQGLEAVKPKYGFYDRANFVNAHPWVAELVIRRAAKSARIRGKLSALLEEKVSPQALTLGRVLRGLMAR